MDVTRNFDTPDEIVEFGGVTEELISIGGLTVSRSTQPPGWRWSEHFKPLVGGEWCQAHHVGIVLSGRQGVELEDGTVIELGPGDLYDVPPGHDGYTIGEEPTVMIEWSGMRSWVGGPRDTVPSPPSCSPTWSTRPGPRRISGTRPGTSCCRYTSRLAETRWSAPAAAR